MSIVDSPIDLAALPTPDALEEVSFDEIYQARKRRLVELFPQEVQEEVQRTLELESEPMSILLQESSYREIVLRERINDCVRRVLLAFARGADLDHLGARNYVQRLVVQEADPTTNPPRERIMESDEAFLERIQDAYEGLSTAGPRGAYVFHARSADGRVADAQAVSPVPCEVVVYVLSMEGDGTASQELIDRVYEALNDEDIRPLADRLTVESSTIVRYTVKARLHMKHSGAGGGLALDAARGNVDAFVHRRKRQGHSVWRNYLEHLMYVEGVSRVELEEPVADLVLTEGQAALCEGVTIVLADDAGDDEDVPA